MKQLCTTVFLLLAGTAATAQECVVLFHGLARSEISLTPMQLVLENAGYHVINRGNGRAFVFHNQADYLRFTEMMQQACERLPLRLVSWCLMPNHFHLVLWPYRRRRPEPMDAMADDLPRATSPSSL